MNKIFEQIDKLFEQTNKIVKRICLRPCRSKRNWRSLSVILVEVITKILVIKKENSTFDFCLIAKWHVISIVHSRRILCLFRKNQFERIVKDLNCLWNNHSERTRTGDVDLLFQSMLDNNIFGLFEIRDQKRKAYFDLILIFSLSYVGQHDSFQFTHDENKYWKVASFQKFICFTF